MTSPSSYELHVKSGNILDCLCILLVKPTILQLTLFIQQHFRFRGHTLEASLEVVFGVF